MNLTLVYLFFGAMLAAIDLATVNFAARHGHKPLAGLILGGYALGSAAGGLWCGSRAWRAPLRRRFTITLGAAAAGTATFRAMPGLATLAAVMLISGLVLSPMLITGFSLIEQQAPAARLTESAWLTSAISVGTAAGSAAAGQVIDASGARGGYVFAAACGFGAILTCLAGLARLTVPSPHPSPAACPDPRRNQPAAPQQAHHANRLPGCSPPASAPTHDRPRPRTQNGPICT